MSFQWRLAASMMYAELAMTAILCIPFISSSRWQKFFKLKLLQQMASACKLVFYCAVVFQAVLFIDSLQSTIKYQNLSEDKEMKNHYKKAHENLLLLFRSQRNLYISGFALFLLLVIYRLQRLISSNALMYCSSEAFRRQAENASKTAEQFMSENERLKLNKSMSDELKNNSGQESGKGQSDTKGIEEEEEILDGPIPQASTSIPQAKEPERFGDLQSEKENIRKRTTGSFHEAESDRKEVDSTKDVTENKKDY